MNIEKELENFISQNPHVSIKEEDNNIIIDTPWGEKDCRLVVEQDDIESIDLLNNIILNVKLDAIIHEDKALVELFFGFIKDDDELYKDCIERKFYIQIHGLDFLCYYGPPTKELLKFSTFYKKLPSQNVTTTAQQLASFRDSQNEEILQGKGKAFFDRRIPINFFIEIPKTKGTFDLIDIARYINFIMTTYDRDTPIINIREDNLRSRLEKDRVRYIKGKFPDKLITHEYDSTMLKLIDVAYRSEPREAFLIF